MARVIYLLDVDDTLRMDLIEKSLNGKHWERPTPNGKKAKISDREMVEQAVARHPWIQQVYRYGCNMIHLSNWHGYETEDPTDALPGEERASIRRQLEAFHGRDLGETSFEMLVMHAPYAIRKIGDNLECYLKDLEKRVGGLGGALGTPDRGAEANQAAQQDDED